MFVIGQEYHRKTEIHDVYKGQEQGGISTPKNFPLIFLFTSNEGESHGYTDEYRNDGIFWYTGEGQIGDMKMLSGNKAILEHTENNKTIHAFEYTRMGYVRYLGTAQCIGYHEEIRPDREGNNRKAFIFHLDINSVPVEKQIVESSISSSSKTIKKLKNKSLQELRNAALNQAPANSSKKERRQIAYYRSEALKIYSIARSGGKCESCNSNAPFRTKSGPFLECHHVHRLADGGPDHPENVIALCPNCHRKAHYAIESKTFNDSLKFLAKKAEQLHYF